MEKMMTMRLGTGLLVLGAILVGIAIAMDGTTAKATNGVGGVLWFASAAVLLVVAIRTRPPRLMWATLVVQVLVVAFIVKPADWMLALAGFTTAGLVIGSFATHHRMLWAVLVPAWYLPAHIGTAVLKASVRSVLGQDAPLRTDPPPTASVVPLVIVLSALMGGYLAVWWTGRHNNKPVQSTSTPVE